MKSAESVDGSRGRARLPRLLCRGVRGDGVARRQRRGARERLGGIGVPACCVEGETEEQEHLGAIRCQPAGGRELVGRLLRPSALELHRAQRHVDVRVAGHLLERGLIGANGTVPPAERNGHAGDGRAQRRPLVAVRAGQRFEQTPQATATKSVRASTDAGGGLRDLVRRARALAVVAFLRRLLRKDAARRAWRQQERQHEQRANESTPDQHATDQLGAFSNEAACHQCTVYGLQLDPCRGRQKSACTLNFTNRGGTMLVGTRHPEMVALL